MIGLVSIIVSDVAGIAVLDGYGESDHASAELIESGMPASATMAYSLAKALAVLTIVLLAAFFSPVPWRHRLRLKMPALSPGALLIAVVGALMLWMVFVSAVVLAGVPQSSESESFRELLSALRGGGLLVAVLLIGVLPPIVLELLFRGYMQTRLSQRWGVRWSILLIALMSAGLYYREPSIAILAGALGLYLGALTERAGSIIPAMICHAAVWASWIAVVGAGILLPSLFWYYAGLAIAMSVLALCVRSLRLLDVVIRPPAAQSPGTR